MAGRRSWVRQSKGYKKALDLATAHRIKEKTMLANRMAQWVLRTRQLIQSPEQVAKHLVMPARKQAHSAHNRVGAPVLRIRSSHVIRGPARAVRKCAPRGLTGDAGRERPRVWCFPRIGEGLRCDQAGEERSLHKPSRPRAGGETLRMQTATSSGRRLSGKHGPVRAEAPEVLCIPDAISSQSPFLGSGDIERAE
jgi:hypothetical protein